MRSWKACEVEGVYELMPYANGLHRNVKNCLEDFGIPAAPIHHRDARDRSRPASRPSRSRTLDEDLSPIPEPSASVPCDTLLLSVGAHPRKRARPSRRGRRSTRGHAAHAWIRTCKTNVDGTSPAETSCRFTTLPTHASPPRRRARERPRPPTPSARRTPTPSASP
ncbi:MAG: hypothetical protein ACLTSX_06550 [Collinsella sp.]